MARHKRTLLTIVALLVICILGFGTRVSDWPRVVTTETESIPSDNKVLVKEANDKFVAESKIVAQLKDQSIPNTEEKPFKAGVFVLAGNDMFRKLRVCRGLMHALPLLWENMMRYYPEYKLHILHEPGYSKDFKESIKSSYPGDLEFNQITLPTMSKLFLAERNEFAKKQNSGYAKMCQFWFWDFLHLEVVQQYDYVMRFDTDSCFESALVQDPFEMMHKQNKVYGYRFRFWEPVAAIENLLPQTSQYIKERSVTPIGCGFYIQPEKDDYHWCGNGGKKPSKGCSFPVFSTNFEILKVDAFLQDDLVAYAKWILESGGIAKYRWGDAPLRTLQLEMFYEAEQLLHLCEFQYQHSLWNKNYRCEDLRKRETTAKQVYECRS